MSRPTPKPPRPRKAIAKVPPPSRRRNLESTATLDRASTSGLREAYRPPAPSLVDLGVAVPVAVTNDADEPLRPLAPSEYPTLTPDPQCRVTRGGFELTRNMVVEHVSESGKRYRIECQPGLIVSSDLGAVPLGLRSAFVAASMRQKGYPEREIEQVAKALWAADMSPETDSYPR